MGIVSDIGRAFATLAPVELVYTFQLERNWQGSGENHYAASMVMAGDGSGLLTVPLCTVGLRNFFTLPRPYPEQIEIVLTSRIPEHGQAYRFESPSSLSHWSSINLHTSTGTENVQVYSAFMKLLARSKARFISLNIIED